MENKEWKTLGQCQANMLALYARIKGMEADNTLREINNDSPAYGSEHFFAAEREAEEIAAEIRQSITG